MGVNCLRNIENGLKCFVKDEIGINGDVFDISIVSEEGKQQIGVCGLCIQVYILDVILYGMIDMKE